MPASKKQNFLHGALILSAATALVKIIGAVFKIPLQNLIGPIGYSYFDIAYSIYSTLFVISSAGLPVAISKMVSEAGARRRFIETRHIFRLALGAFVCIGAVGSLVLFFGARVLAGWMGNPDAYQAIMAIAPSVLFVSVMSAFRGYHQGQGNMYPTAISQVIEASCKLGVGYLLAAWVYSSDLGLEQAAAAAISGVTVGSVMGALYMMLARRRRLELIPTGADPATRSRRALLREILRLSVPVTISASVLSLTNLIDKGLVMNRLFTAGYALPAAKKVVGAYSFAQTLFNLPSAFILTISVSIIPALTVALTHRDDKMADGTIRSALRITSLLAMPAAAGLSSLALPILTLLSMHQPETVEIAAPLLVTLGFAVVFVCLVSLTNAILQAMGLVNVPIVTMFAGGCVKLVANYFLVGNPAVNIAGAPVGTVLCYAVISLLNLGVIVRVRGGVRFWGVFVRPLLAAAGMGAFAHLFYRFVTDVAGCGVPLGGVISMAAAVVVYGALVLLLRAVPREDILLLPRGEKLVKIMKL
ncbi:MAG: polysaccharide biosynthesis protein [Oscillospiraceae bacterium]|jgi:stage V sporulation protein B|nr:polysaccharide biosynthesis protein [Oscillospiraceae bacterium]